MLHFYCFCFPGPAKGLSLSSQMVTPSQAQNRFEFLNNPEEEAMIPHDKSFPQFPLI